MRPHKNAKIDRMRAVPLFAHCSRRELEAIASAADELSLPEGSVLTREGKRGGEFGVIESGTAVVHRGDEKLRDLGPGDFFGEIALITDSPRTATVVTTSPVRLLVLTRQSFSRVLRDSDEIQAKVLQALAERLAPHVD